MGNSQVSYKDFAECVRSLNERIARLPDSNGQVQQFRVVRSSVQRPLPWRKTIKIECGKADRDAFTPSHTVGFAKFIRLFAQLYQDLAYVEAEGNLLKESTAENMWTVVDIENRPSLSEPLQCKSAVNRECCLCMEKTADATLACTHNFCSDCLGKWRKASNGPSCPYCRQKTNDDKETWHMAECVEGQPGDILSITVALHKKQEHRSKSNTKHSGFQIN